jgi:nicotinate dehydrogenase subunit A
MGVEAIELLVNGSLHTVTVEPETPLIYVLRNDLRLTGTKLGCALEQCRACLVLVDGEPATSCATAVEAFAGKAITTIEGIGTPESLDPVQQAFVDEGAGQCGYCIPGIVVAARALLDRNEAPGEAEIREALAGHLCRCGSHGSVLRAIARASR